MSLFILLAFLCLASAELAPLLSNSRGELIPGQYIVIYQDHVTTEQFAEEMQNTTYAVTHQYKHVFKGFTAKLSDDELMTVRANPLVNYVEQDQIGRASQQCVRATANSWGLSRISEVTMSLDGVYTYPSQAGQGVVAYVLDTGIYLANTDFENRASFGWKAENSWSTTDAAGHGTHVASTIIGRNYGVAKRATAVAVKVLGDNGSGSYGGIIGGIDWVLAQFLSNGKPSVINMSLGGGFSAALNTAVNNCVNGGVINVVAAGNSDADACATSPASATSALTVGATTISVTSTDARASYSNYGPCVSVFAPGSSITAAWIGSASAINTISGTSMASPHVAGIAAVRLSQTPSVSAATLRSNIIAESTAGLISMNCSPGASACSGSPNLMVWNQCTHA